MHEKRRALVADDTPEHRSPFSVDDLKKAFAAVQLG
jgi:hypothetical protein